MVPDVDAVALAVGGDLAADVAHVVAVKLGLQEQVAMLIPMEQELGQYLACWSKFENTFRRFKPGEMDISPYSIIHCF